MTCARTSPVLRAALLALALLLQTWSTPADAADTSVDILDQLWALPGMQVRRQGAPDKNKV